MLCRLFTSVATLGLMCAVWESPIHAAEEPVATPISQEDRNFFEKEVRPLLVKRCFECHGETKAGRGLSPQTAKIWRKGRESGPAVIPGKPDESPLISAVNYRDLEILPVDDGGKLPAEEIAILTKWVAMGAPDPRDGSDAPGGMAREEVQKWWVFQPLPAASAIDSAANGERMIDALIEREWKSRNLTATPRTDTLSFRSSHPARHPAERLTP